MALIDGLNSYWKLDGDSNDSKSTNNGTDTAITYSAGNGIIVQGAGLNGTTSKIVITDATSLKPSGSFSVNMWVKILNNTGLQMLFQSYSQNTNTAGFYVDLESNGTIAFLSAKNSGTTVDVDYKAVLSSGVVDNGSFHMVTAVYGGSNLKVYIDGSLDATSGAWANAPAYAATNYVRIGTKNNSGTDGSFYAGAIDEIGLWSKELSTTEITQLYNGGAGLPYAQFISSFFIMF